MLAGEVDGLTPVASLTEHDEATRDPELMFDQQTHFPRVVHDDGGSRPPPGGRT
jgi:hypothetical protein